MGRSRLTWREIPPFPPGFGQDALAVRVVILRRGTGEYGVAKWGVPKLNITVVPQRNITGELAPDFQKTMIISQK